ncbi:MAG: CesT family type III secretion system chaperone [Janthinobacterium lividum]
MTDAQFKALCERAGRELDEKQCASLVQFGQVDIDGVTIGLFLDEQESPDILFCYVDLGAVEHERRAHVFENLLTLNLLSGTKTTGVYAIDPASGNALFIVHLYEPETLEGKVLAEALRTYADQAKALRQGLLLTPPAPQDGRRQNGAASMMDLA